MGGSPTMPEELPSGAPRPRNYGQGIQNIPTIFVVGIFIAVGTYFMTVSRADTTAVSSEVEQGQLTGGAQVVEDAAASGPGAVRFGAAASILELSLESDRSPAIGGSVTVSAGTPLYVSITSADISSVAFTVKDSSGAMIFSRSEMSSPFDMIGAAPNSPDPDKPLALPWNPGVGSYAVTANVTYKDGKTATYSVPVTVNPGTVTPPTPTPPSNPTNLDTSYDAAWLTSNHETLRGWFNANAAGPSPSGTHGGGTITTQAQADAMAGKTVTGTVTINGSLTLRDVRVSRSVVNINSGTVRLENVLIDAQNVVTGSCGYLNIRGGNVDLYRVQMRGTPDGIRMLGSPNLTAKYLYIHSPTRNVSCNGHHDGIQVMGGSASIQRSFVDYSGGPSSGQGILVKADSQDIKTFRYTKSYFTGGGNAMTFVPTNKGFPDVIDLTDLMGSRGCLKDLFSIYLTSSAQTAMITKWNVKISPSGKVVQIRNGLACASL